MLWDVLAEVVSVGQLPLQENPTPTQLNWGSVINHTEERATGLVRDGSPSPGHRRTSELPIHALQFHPTSLITGGVGTYAQMVNSVPFAPTSFAPTPVTVRPENILSDIYPDPTQASRELADMMDSDAMAMWTSVPMGLSVDDWGTYFSSFSQMAEGEGRQYDEWSSNGATD
ncbi:hypothetical protein B0H12DRAFT_229682 [Mycena haematopus]|nr:hypothetical protein B0H12DRAFT_229682 [Mycena haematopus]